MAILVPITNAEMTRFLKHFFIFSIFTRSYSYQIDVTGELSFGMRISDADSAFERALDEIKLKVKKKILDDDNKDEEEIESGETSEEDDVKELNDKPGRVTVGPIVECLYQYPDVQQFKALLSSMMNELTKVNKRGRKRDARRYGTRFRVVDKKDTYFFEEIFANMTKEYRDFYNSTTERVARAVEDPCNNQEELKRVWKELLDNSLASLRRSSLLCFEEFLRTNRSDDSRTRRRLDQYLEKELTKIRARQLHMLCDSFQLCYNELL